MNADQEQCVDFLFLPGIALDRVDPRPVFFGKR
jgi:hypothetical protein